MDNSKGEVSLKKTALSILGKFSYNSPVILTFALLALLVFIVESLTGESNRLLFSVYRSGWSNLLTYLRMFTHVLGHESLAHLTGNFTVILIAGPMLEEKHGAKAMITMIVVTAFITGLFHIVFGQGGTAVLGASGVVFMLILLASFSNIKAGQIPITLVVCVVVFLVPEIAASVNDDSHHIARFAHIIGGVCGACFGFLLNREAKAEAKSEI